MELQTSAQLLAAPAPAVLYQGVDTVSGVGLSTAIQGTEATHGGNSQVAYRITSDASSLYESLGISQSLAVGFGPFGSVSEKVDNGRIGRGDGNCGSVDGDLVGALVTLVVHPAHGQLVTLGAALELEGQVGVLGHGGAELCCQHLLAVVLGRQLGDEMGRNQVAGGVLALPGFHLVAHQHLYFGDAVLRASANLHGICHFLFLFRIGFVPGFSRRSHRG